MFKKSTIERQLDIFGDAKNFLESSSVKIYNDENHWHNQFYIEVVMRIDEEKFRKLYSEKMGAPNASIRILTGMMIIKEAFGWSDSQLYEQCQFNMLVRSALGLANINDKLPALSTYYLLRQKLHAYQIETGEDIFGQIFKDITGSQVKEFNVNGRTIRMDSKLFGSNIALYSRYEIIVRSLQLFYKSNKEKVILSGTDSEKISVLMGEDPQKTVYQNTKEEIKSNLQEVGMLIYKLLKLAKDKQSASYKLLQRVFKEQYKVLEEKKIELRAKEEITSSSVQSPHDPDSAYRNKAGKKIKGYSTNLTETCSEEGLNLITSIITEKANVPDTQFVEQAIKDTIEVTGHEVEKAYMDGAYQSPDNDKFCEGIDMVYTGIQGGDSRYELEMTAEGLLVTDTHTGEQQIAHMAKKGKNSKEDRYRITTSSGYYYFGQLAIRASHLRRQMKQRPEKESKMRNNVESTVNHYSYPLRNQKSKYRGLIKQKMWSYLRGLWVNLVRIVKFVTQKLKKTNENSQNLTLKIIFALISAVKHLVAHKLKNRYNHIVSLFYPKTKFVYYFWT